MSRPRRASSEVREAALAVLEWLGEPVDAPGAYEVIRRDRHSNHVDEVHLPDGRILVVKRAREAGGMDRFETSRRATDLLAATGVEVPRYLDPPPALEGEPVLVYWWVPGVTLHDLWPGLAETRRPAVLESWGGLIRRMQSVRLPGHGSLVDVDERKLPLEDFCSEDLGERLLPVVEAVWPSGLPAVRGLLEELPALGDEAGGSPAVVVHNDLFDQNVLCPEHGNDPVCVGVIDLEDALAAPPEAELAKTEILHGPLFGQPWEGDWLTHLEAGWGREPNPFTVAWFRAHQLVNMGLHARVVGLAAHAEELAVVARAEVEALGSSRRHAEICLAAIA